MRSLASSTFYPAALYMILFLPNSHFLLEILSSIWHIHYPMWLGDMKLPTCLCSSPYNSFISTLKMGEFMLVYFQIHQHICHLGMGNLDRLSYSYTGLKLLCVVEDNPELLIFLILPPKCLDDRCVLSCVTHIRVAFRFLYIVGISLWKFPICSPT